jgi:hypothetical protein
MGVTHGNIKTIMQDSGRYHEIRGNVEISPLVSLWRQSSLTQ